MGPPIKEERVDQNEKNALSRNSCEFADHFKCLRVKCANFLVSSFQVGTFTMSGIR